MTTPDTITLGPPTSPWHYTRSTRTFDLTRGAAPSTKSLTIATTQGPPDTRVRIDPARSALVVVDMQNFFLSPEMRAHPLGLAAVEPTVRLLGKCREEGVQVIWLNWGLTDTDMATLPAGVQRGFSRDLLYDTSEASRSGLGSDLGSNRGRTLFAGTWNADIWPPLKALVQPADIHCAKNRMSGMWSEEQPLWKHLVKEGKSTLLFTGVNTDQCVLGTLANAYNAGWDCLLVDDAAATTTEGGREVCVYNIANSYGFVIDSKTFAEAK